MVEQRFPGHVLAYVTSPQELRANLSAGETIEAVVVDPCGFPEGWLRELEDVARAYPHVPLILLSESDAEEAVADTGTQGHARCRPFVNTKDFQVRQEWRQTLASLAVPAFLVSGNGVILEANEAVGELVGLSARSLLGRRCADVFHPGRERPPNCPLVQARETGKYTVAEVRMPSGRTYLIACSPLIGHGAPSPLFLHISLDLTTQRQVEAWRQVGEQVLEATTEGVVVTDENRIIRWVNEVFPEITGYAAEEVVGRSPFFVVASDGESTLPPQAEEQIAGGRSWQGQMWFRHKSGEVFPRWVTISGMKDEQGGILGYVAVCTAVAHKVNDPQARAHVAHHDALTGLGNRLQFYSRFQAAASSALRRGLPLALFYLNLDHLRGINAAFGYAAGDQVLREVGRRLRAAVRDEDTVVRIAGDEFALLLALEREEDAAPVARKILDRLRRPVRLAGRDLALTASMGIAVFPRDGSDPDTLLRAGRAAAERAKEQGRGSFSFHHPELRAAYEERFILEQELARGVEAGQFEIHYQPRFRLRDGGMSGAEALLRWRHPARGLVLPEAFIEVAEASGLIVPLDVQALRTACAQANAWRGQGYNLTISVNFSARHFLREDSVDTVARILKETGLDPGFLELEITETTAVKNVKVTSSKLAALRSLGIGIAIDDFGTGYGSLHYLRHFPVTTLKIDRSFVRGLPADQQDAAIAAAIIAMARSLGCAVVAEGVETAEQLAWLRDHGCEEVQGFLLCPPVPPDEVTSLLKAGGVSPILRRKETG